MASNTSATGGYLHPATPAPYGDGLLHPMHDHIAGVTELPNDLVRPRWQPSPSNQPPLATDWCAFGIEDMSFDPWAYIDSDIFIRHEEIAFLLTFYGPDALGNAMKCSDGMLVKQNDDLAQSTGLYFGSHGQLTHTADLVNDRWVDRYDLPLNFRRKILRQYGILTIETAGIDLYNDAGLPKQSIEVSP